jgi:hypothetical protein
VTIFSSKLALALVVAALVLGSTNCGSGSDAPTPIGPEAILNGATGATATSYWRGNCGVDIVLAANHDVWSVIHYINGNTLSSTGGIWQADGNSAKMIGYYVTLLGNIQGSTAQRMFTANVVVHEGYDQELDGCRFQLVDQHLDIVL